MLSFPRRCAPRSQNVLFGSGRVWWCTLRERDFSSSFVVARSLSGARGTNGIVETFAKSRSLLCDGKRNTCASLLLVLSKKYTRSHVLLRIRRFMHACQERSVVHLSLELLSSIVVREMLDQSRPLGWSSEERHGNDKDAITWWSFSLLC